VLTPYVAQTHHEQGVYFAEHGYPFLTVDVRGRGNSEGRFSPATEARDGHDIVEWIAQQPYCNGQVGMWGGSYMGYVQWAAAKEFPPHLATIVPVASPFRGVDSPIRNNLFPTFTMRWLTLISGHALQDKIGGDKSFWTRKFRQWFESGAAFKELDTFLGNPSALFQEWIQHPQQGGYWDSYNPTSEQYAKLCLPILTITGAYDGDQPGALMHYQEHLKSCSVAARERHYLVIGPWDHSGTRTPKQEFCGLKAGPASLVDLPKLHLQWYAWTMQGGAKPEFLQKHVAYYVMGAEKWRYADTLEAVTARSQPLYLQSAGNPTDVFNSGSLTAEPVTSSEPDHYIYDPCDVSLAELESTVDPENRIDQRMVYASAGKHLIYHSAPFGTDTELSGFFKLSVWISIDQLDTDFRASVYEIGIDGSAIQLTADWMRARYRESFREEKLIGTRAPLRYDFERFTFVSRRISQGHRLRLVIGPINSIYSQKNYNSGGAAFEESIQDSRPVTVRLFHDEAHPSALYLPFGQPEL
jgi:putative CocE/NonD family hydrolase